MAVRRGHATSRDETVKRSYISLRTKLASALCQLVRYDDENACFVKIIPHDEAKKLSEDDILSRFEFQHYPIPKAHDGPDVHWNIEPMVKAKHREITAKIDIPRIAKSKRLVRSSNGHKQRLGAKDRGEDRPASRWPKRKMESRGFERRA